MLNNKSKLSLLAAGLLFSLMTACSGEYQPAREINNSDSSVLPGYSAHNNMQHDNMRNNMNDSSSNPGGVPDSTNGKMK